MQSHSMSGESTKPYILKKCIALLLSCGSSTYKFKQVHAFSIRRGVPLSSPEMGQENSGFVLSSPNIESHLITSVREYYYCALAKGPLLPDHVLIMPIEHTPNALSRPLECEKELERLQSCLKAYFKKQGKEAVFFEWVFKQGSNANLQNEDKRCGHSLTEAAAYFMLKFLEVLAGLLNVANRAYWRNCKLDKEEDTKMVETFKNGVQEYDPNQ